METVCIILAILLGICLLGYGIFYLYFRRMQKKWKAAAEDNLRLGKEEAAAIIRKTMDTVNAEKDRMEGLPEKKILIEAMTALAAQSRRLDRMEEKMEIVVNYADSIEALKKIISTTEGALADLQTQFKETASLLTSAQQSVQGLNTAVSQFTSILGHTESLQKQLSAMSSDAQKTAKQLEALDSRTKTVVSGTEKLFDDYRNGPMEQLHTLTAHLNTVDSTLTELKRTVDASIGTTDSAMVQKLEILGQKISGISTELAVLRKSAENPNL